MLLLVKNNLSITLMNVVTYILVITTASAAKASNKKACRCTPTNNTHAKNERDTYLHWVAASMYTLYFHIVVSHRHEFHANT